MATVRQAIAALQAHAITAGAKEAPNDPPESNVAFPFAVCYMTTANIEVEAYAQRRDIVTLVLDYHWCRELLPLDIQAVMPFYESFPDLLINDPTLGGTVDTIRFGKDSSISVQFGGMEYAGQKTIGFRFSIPVKIRSAAA